MKFEDLPTNEAVERVWSRILADAPPADSWDSTYYSGAFSTVDSAEVEPITAERIARVDAWFGDGGHSYAEQDFTALVELTDGMWAAVVAWCDTSGWGCQQGVQWKVSPTRDEAISWGLDRTARQKLGLSLPGEPYESSDDG